MVKKGDQVEVRPGKVDEMEDGMAINQPGVLATGIPGSVNTTVRGSTQRAMSEFVTHEGWPWEVFVFDVYPGTSAAGW